MPGSDNGMNSSVPSSREGMKSLPSRDAGRCDRPIATNASAIVSFFQRGTSVTDSKAAPALEKVLV